MDLEDFEKKINEQNNWSIPVFEGYSPIEMNMILNHTLEEGSPIQLQKPSDSDYQRIPILNQVKYLLKLIDKSGEIKLTQRGNLPRKVVAELYQQGYLKEREIEEGYRKLYKESDSPHIHITRILCELTRLTKKRKGKLSLTKLGEKILNNNYELWHLLFITFTTEFNWAYQDRYEDERIGQFGFGFSLILLSKYGHKKRLDSFYAEKYFNAFPGLFDINLPNFEMIKIFAIGCYSFRTFHRFMHYFDLVKIDEGRNMLNSKIYVTKTDLFDRLIKCLPHKKQDL